MSLEDAARVVRENAYAPYSDFKVGASLRTPSGAVFSGCNVENVAYPEGTCAEAGAIAAMKAAGFEIAVETNGTIDPPPGIDWLTVSPKPGPALRVRSGHELKLVFPQAVLPSSVEDLDFEVFYLQPCDGPLRRHNTELAIDYCRRHPQWRLSLQTHKFVGIP